MHHLKSLLLFSVIVFTAIILSSCQENPTTMTQETQSLPSLQKFTLPAGAVFDSARFYIYCYNPKSHLVTVHDIMSDWDEHTVTWTSFGNSFNPAYVDSFRNYEGSPGWKTADVTSLVGDWLSGGPNYGLLLKDSVDASYQAGRSYYHSREYSSAEYSPYLEIFYTLGGTQSDTTRDIADTYIWQLEPDNNFGSYTVLYTGTAYPPNQLKYTLIKFELDVAPPSGGCTLTPGYWQTHSQYGPAPYDDTWAQIGEDTPFFTSGKSYYETLWTSPKGNAYYILSFQYIAAELNFLNGADPTDAQTAFDAATILFNTYSPDDIAAMKGNDPVRQQFISLAETLDDYNNGYIGPGHCDD